MNGSLSVRPRISRTRYTTKPAAEQTTASLVPDPARPGGVDLLIDVISEVPQGEPGRYAVLLSTPSTEHADDSAHGSGGPNPDVSCFLAFSNVQVWGNRLRERGFNCVEAQIGIPEDKPSPHLTVGIPFYPPDDATTEGSSVRYTAFLTIEPIPASPSSAESIAALDTLAYQPGSPPPVLNAFSFFQLCTVPEPGRPRTEFAARHGSLNLQATPFTALAEGAYAVEPKVTVKRARYPSLVPVSSNEALPGKVVSTGHLIDWPPPALTNEGGKTGAAVDPPQVPPPIRRPRTNPFGAPSFRFRGLRSVGFRVDLSEFGTEADDVLTKLVEPLNFHLRSDARGRGMSVTPFRYRAASRTVVIELLRYDKMIDADSPVLRSDDFTAQHELAVRVLVGRVDDDTAQARSPAVFVPAIFVDNPWSKVVGRELLGYEKQLANFCVGDPTPDVLNMDGVLPHSKVLSDVPQITSLRMAPQINVALSKKDREVLLNIDCPTAAVHAARFIRADLLTVSSGTPTSSRWSQSDFEEAEFRRGFAQDVIKSGFMTFDSIQASPIDCRDLPRSWITGRYTLTDVEVSFPNGIATLRFPARKTLDELGDDVPEAWKIFCGLLDGQSVALTTGDWYLLKCDMDLEIDDVLKRKRNG